MNDDQASQFALELAELLNRYKVTLVNGDAGYTEDEVVVIPFPSLKWEECRNFKISVDPATGAIVLTL